MSLEHLPPSPPPLPPLHLKQVTPEEEDSLLTPFVVSESRGPPRIRQSHLSQCYQGSVDGSELSHVKGGGGGWGNGNGGNGYNFKNKYGRKNSDGDQAQAEGGGGGGGGGGGLQYRSIYIGYIQDDIGVDVDIDIGKIRPQCAEEKGVLSHLYINEL